MKKAIVLETPKEDVTVYTFVSPEEIRRFNFDRQFSEHTNFRSIYTRRESLMKRAAEEDASVVLALTESAKIIGFVVLAYPEADQRWAGLRPKLMMEVKAVEVSRNWRGLGIGDALVAAMLTHPRAEEKIIYFVGYTWTWDLEGAGVPASEYKKMMMRLFQPRGFVEFKTNEPNICLDADNLFMCRIGKDITEEVRNDLKWLAFGIFPGQ